MILHLTMKFHTLSSSLLENSKKVILILIRVWKGILETIKIHKSQIIKKTKSIVLKKKLKNWKKNMEMKNKQMK